jgi:hypothetical protein
MSKSNISQTWPGRHGVQEFLAFIPTFPVMFIGSTFGTEHNFKSQ